MQNEAKLWEKGPIKQKANKPLDFSAYGELVGPAPSASSGTAPTPAQSDLNELDYDGVVWTCALLPYRIIACRDAIQYIVQVRNEKAYRSLSYFSEWEPISRHYPQLAIVGLPQQSPEVLSHEVRRRGVRLEILPANFRDR